MWWTGVTLALLTLVAKLGPILLASVSLSVYAFETGYLSPSVAFASLGLLSNIHQVIRELPLKVASLQESWISCQRLQCYLDDPEQHSTFTSSDHISLEDA